MKVIVDTCIWSLVLRRHTAKNTDITIELTELINEVRVQMLGPIRQEILSGIKLENMFKTLTSYLSAFPDLELETQDYEKAAEFFNICRRNGIQGSNTDFLLCAAAVNREYEIFTVDKDFHRYKQYLPVKLYKMRYPL